MSPVLAGAAVQPAAARRQAGGAVGADPEGPEELHRGHREEEGGVRGAEEEMCEELLGDRCAGEEAAEAPGFGRALGGCGSGVTGVPRSFSVGSWNC